MAGRTSETSLCKLRKICSRGFALTEILVVVLIIAILLGVTGTVFSGIITFAERADDQSIARRRADDVFNVLRVPMLNAGLGVPSASLDYYFTMGHPVGPSAPVAGWAGPVEVVSNNTYPSGNAIRLIYSVRSGGRNGKNEIKDFSTKDNPGNVMNWIPPYKTVELAAGGVPEVEGSGVWDGNGVVLSPVDVRAFVTFPGVFKSPLYVAKYDSADAAAGRIHLAGKTPHVVSEDGDVLWRNVIHPNHEMYLVRAGVAYVDDKSRFCFTEVTTDDPSLSALPPGSNIIGGFVIDGIAAINFTQAADKRIVKVTVLAEGDSVETEREGRIDLTPLQTRWPGVPINGGKRYEEFSMSWRTRNLGGE